jgi:hypothetical protein
MPGETHFFDDIYARRRELGDPRRPEAMSRIIGRLLTLYGRYNEPTDQQRVEKLFSDPTILENLRTTGTTYAGILTYFMGIQMSYEGKARWGNNVPKDIFSVEDVIAFYPHVKILICIRDARDFLLSYQNKWKITSSENVARLKKLYHPILTTLLWKLTMRKIGLIKSAVSEKNLMIVKYESLVRDPEDTVRTVCTFIEEEFEEAMLRVDMHNSSFQPEEKGIFSSSVGRWRQKLPREEAYFAQKLAGRELKEFGYPLDKLSVRPSQLARIVVTFPYAIWKAFDANKGNRGPLISYLVKRLMPF